MKVEVDCGRINFCGRRPNALENAWHPKFGLVWTNGSRVFFSLHSKDVALDKSVDLFRSLDKEIVSCQWIVRSKTLLAVTTKDGEVGLWEFSYDDKLRIRHLASLIVMHEINGFIQMSSLNLFAVFGPKCFTVLRLSEQENSESRRLGMNSLRSEFSGCCWSESQNCLIFAFPDGCIQRLGVVMDGYGCEFMGEGTVESPPGRLRSIAAAGKFVICTFDAPILDGLESTTTDHPKQNAKSPSEEGRNVYNILNLTSQLSGHPPSNSSSSSSSSFGVFKIVADENVDPCKFPPRIDRTCALKVKDIIIPDEILVHEISPVSFVVIVASSRCSTISMFAFNTITWGIQTLDSLDLEGQRVKGMTIGEGRLICFLSEPGGEGSLYLASQDEVDVKVVTFENHVLRHRPHGQTPRAEPNSEPNPVKPSVAWPKRKSLVKEVSSSTSSCASPCDGQDGEGLKQPQITQHEDTVEKFTCCHCGKENLLHHRPASSATNGRHGNISVDPDFKLQLESIVANAVRSEFVKLKAEIVSGLKASLNFDAQ